MARPIVLAGDVTTASQLTTFFKRVKSLGDELEQEQKENGGNTSDDSDESEDDNSSISDDDDDTIQTKKKSRKAKAAAPPPATFWIGLGKSLGLSFPPGSTPADCQYKVESKLADLQKAEKDKEEAELFKRRMVDFYNQQPPAVATQANVNAYYPVNTAGVQGQYNPQMTRGQFQQPNFVGVRGSPDVSRYVTCFNCGEQAGHYANNCPHPRSSPEFRNSVRDRVAAAQQQYSQNRGPFNNPTGYYQQISGQQQQALPNAHQVARPSPRIQSTNTLEESGNYGPTVHAMEGGVNSIEAADCYVVDADVMDAEKRKRSVASDPPANKKQNAAPVTITPMFRRNPTETPPDAPVHPDKKKHRRSPRPIRMMKGQTSFDPVHNLRTMEVRGLSWGQFLDTTSSARRQVAHGLTQERSNRRRRGALDAAQVDSKQVRPLITNFHTEAKVWQDSEDAPLMFVISKVLIDGGAVLNMIPLYVAKQLNLTLHRQNEVMMRSATGQHHFCDYYVDVSVEIADVVSKVRCFTLPEQFRPSYGLLLGRKWMKDVKAVGDYEHETYVIRGTNDELHPVPRCFDSEVGVQGPVMVINTVHHARSRR